MEDTFVELMTRLCEHYAANENRPLQFGNVEFWTDHGALIHSPSNSEWDRVSLVTDLTAFLLKQQVIRLKDLPELTQKERAAMDSFPPDFVEQILQRGPTLRDRMSSE